jgi:hypothetical protein
MNQTIQGEKGNENDMNIFLPTFLINDETFDTDLRNEEENIFEQLQVTNFGNNVFQPSVIK